MSYFFPSPITTLDIPPVQGIEPPFTVNSGENALRLLLRSFKLNPGSKVAIPQFVCDAVSNAVFNEGLNPLALDTYPNAYWTNYDKTILDKEKPLALVLVHLYGFLHPDTYTIIEYCKANNIKLIHDLAQSFGVDESSLTYGSIFYSFGPGKSTTAAGGGIIKEIDTSSYKANISKPNKWVDKKAKIFLETRIYGYELNTSDRLKDTIAAKLSNGNQINAMSPFQRLAAQYAMQLVNNVQAERNKRHTLLIEAIKGSPALSVPYDTPNGLHFKIILQVKDNVGRFEHYLADNKVPYFCLFNAEETKDAPKELENFRNTGYTFVEISTEASIPMHEIERVAGILKNYK
jgi:dTDP-4-amino-4,6-dideoxygalactose transaminase